MNGNNRSIPAFLAFIPFGTFLICRLYPIMSLRWVCLVSLLKSISLLLIYINITDSDFLWSIFGILTFIVVCMPVYLNAVKIQDVVDDQKDCDKITLTRLFKICSDNIFSDYRISLPATIPLVMQILVAGSILYGVFGADWVMHTLAGFAIGAVASKAYKTAVTNYGYSHLISYFHLDRFRVSGVEKKISWLGFTLFSVLVVGLAWEIFERVIYLASPINVVRIGPEPLWNATGDVVSAVIGGMTMWYILKLRLKWL